MKNKFVFSLDVETEALAVPQIGEFLAGIYLDETADKYFTVLSGVVKEIKVPLFSFENKLIGEFACVPNASDINEDAVLVSLDIMTSKPTYCFSEERSQLFNYGLQGRSMFETAAEFNAALWANIEGELKEEVEILRWYGNKANTGNPFLKNTDGIITQIQNDISATTSTTVNVIPATASITPSNVIGEISKVVAKLTSLKIKRNEQVIFVSSDVYQALEDAKLMTIIGTGIYGQSSLSQVQIVEVPAFTTTKTMIAMPLGNVAYAYNAKPMDVSPFERLQGTWNWFSLIGLNFVHKILRMNKVVYYA